MKKIFLLTFISSILIAQSEAQFTRYIVLLKNKGGSAFSFSNPIVYLSQRAIDRRIRYGIAIDSADIPVTQSYITQIDNIANVTILNVSKWLNAVTIQTTDPGAITAINSLPFVQNISAIAAKQAIPEIKHQNKFESEEVTSELPLLQSRSEGVVSDYFNYGTESYKEIHLHNGEFLHNVGLRGQGLQIALLDNGFNNYTLLKAFDSARINNQILGSWDFVAREQNVTDDGTHGMQCFSTIAANIPGQFIGKAPKSSFWLYQTEDNSDEYPIEELNWACGAERADSSGADIISSSLGYGYGFDGGVPDYPYSSLDGKTTMSARAANMAARKGIAVFIAAGNAGAQPWHYIITPADADSAVAVGAVSNTAVIGNFSSYGPSSDGQIKPDVASVGVAAVVQTSSNTVGTNNGTSFACPNMAGLATCLWQGFPEFNNMKIIRALKQSGSKYTTPDDRVGYGIPDMKLAFANLLTDFATSSASVNNCNVTLNWSTKDISAMKYEIERKAAGEINFSKIGEMNAQAGDILSNKSYTFSNTLLNVSAGNISYRIRQIIDTASASFYAVYIDTAIVSLPSACVTTGTGNTDPNKVFISIWPNPATGNMVLLVVETPDAISNMPISVFDNEGRLMLQLKESKLNGRKIIEIPIDRLAAGKYYISILNNNKPIGTAELIKQ